MTRKQFLIGMAGVVTSPAVFGAEKTFDEKLKAEMKHVLMKHAHEEPNQSTMYVMEDELNDWAHEYMVSGQITNFKAICYLDMRYNRHAVCLVRRLTDPIGVCKIFEVTLTSL